jgi:rfaE bifunctional protein kinase chain/domain
MKTVFVAGDVMLDAYVEVDATRVSPEAPVLIGCEKERTYRLGGAGNAARNCKAMGSCDVALSGWVGPDLEADILRGLASDLNICYIRQNPNTETTVKTRFIDSEGRHLFRFDRDGGVQAGHHIVFEPTYETLLISDYGKGGLNIDEIFEMIALAKQNDMFVVVNGKPKSVAAARQADCLVFNRREAQEALMLLGRGVPDSDEYLIKQLFSKILDLNYASLSCLIVTLGAEGFIRARIKADYSIRLDHWSALAYEIMDPVGAGDTVTATIAVHGNYSDETMELASRNAASVVSQRGTAVPR